MPELPEVEAARQALEEHCIGKKIMKCAVADDPKVIIGISSKDFEAALVGKTIAGARRKGKNMWLELDSPPFPSFQFGMAGALYIKGVAVTKYKRSAVKDTDEWPSKYSKLFVKLADGLEFSFTDKRRFAKVRLLDNPVLVPPISELGPDALLEPMTVDEFYDSLSKKKIGIKTLLLEQKFILNFRYQLILPSREFYNRMQEEGEYDDLCAVCMLSNEHLQLQLGCGFWDLDDLLGYIPSGSDESFISGIGNWMADEVLYQARIHPLQTASSISKESCVTLLRSINEVTNIAVEVEADSLRFPAEWLFHLRWGKKPGEVIETAVDVGVDSSQFPSNWIFHSREKKPGKASVDGKKIEFIDARGRTTAYVPELQKLPDNQNVKETVKKSKGKAAGKGEIDDSSGDEDKPEKSKVVKGRKASSARKPSNKKSSAKVEDSDDDEDDNGVDDVSSKRKRMTKNPPLSSKSQGGKKVGDDESRKGRGKSGPAKRKKKGSDDDDDNVSNSSGGGDEDGDEEADEVTNGKRVKAGGASNKRAASKPAAKGKKNSK